MIFLSENKSVLPPKKVLDGIMLPVECGDGSMRSYKWDEYQKPEEVLGNYEIDQHINYYEGYEPKYRLV